MENYVNPNVDLVFNDLAFKKIFGVEENKDLTISLVNAIVTEEDRVANLTFLNPYNLKEVNSDESPIIDIKAQRPDGKYFNIEIQASDSREYDKRALFYWAKLYSKQFKESNHSRNLSKTISINIINFTSISHNKRHHNIFYVTEKEDKLRYFNDMEIHTIELNKFEKRLLSYSKEDLDIIQTPLDAWSYFLTKHYLLNPEMLPSQLDNPQIKKALHVLSHINLGQDNSDNYENLIKLPS